MQLLSSAALLNELQRVLAYPKLAAAFPNPGHLVRLIAGFAEVTHPDRTPVCILSAYASRRGCANTHGQTWGHPAEER